MSTEETADFGLGPVGFPSGTNIPYSNDMYVAGGIFDTIVQDVQVQPVIVREMEL